MTEHPLLNLFADTLTCCNPEKLVKQALSWENPCLSISGTTYDLTGKTIHILGSGKCVAGMGKGAVNILGDEIRNSYLVSNTLDHVFSLNLDRGSHPVPGERSIRCGQKLKQHIQCLDEHDFFIYMLSGGSSSLIEIPEPPLTLVDIQHTTTTLLNSGMDIEEINTFRTLMSSLKGGKLIENLIAKGVALVLSDILGDPLNYIGSGPLIHSERNPDACLKLIETYHLEHTLPEHVTEFIKNYKKAKHPHVPEVPHFIIGNNRTLLEQTTILAKNRGMNPSIQDTPLKGDVSEMADRLASFIQSQCTIPGLYLFGGETTVNVTGAGKGGRNQELALRLLPFLENYPNISILCSGSDGIDGPTDAAGALITHSTLKISEKLNLEIPTYLKNNNSYDFFEKTGSLIKTGPTGNNLLDIVMILVSDE